MKSLYLHAGQADKFLEYQLERTLLNINLKEFCLVSTSQFPGANFPQSTGNPLAHPGVCKMHSRKLVSET